MMTGHVANEASVTDVLEQAPAAIKVLQARQRAAKTHLKKVAAKAAQEEALVAAAIQSVRADASA